jgi:hypothetical protein
MGSSSGAEAGDPVANVCLPIAKREFATAVPSSRLVTPGRFLEMREIRPHRRRFLQAAAAASLAGRLGVRPSRAADLGVDSGPFSTTNETIRKARQAA